MILEKKKRAGNVNIACAQYTFKTNPKREGFSKGNMQCNQ